MRNFKLGTVLSMTTTKLLCDFDEFHEAAQWVLGHSVWTHEFADKAIWDRMRELLLAQYPDLPIEAEVSKSNWREYVAAQEAIFGPTLAIRQGTELRIDDPDESLRRLAPGKPVIVVKP